MPALTLSAANDPLVPAEMYARYPSSSVRTWLTDRGGHVGFFGAGRPRFWAAAAVLDHLQRVTPPRPSRS